MSKRPWVIAISVALNVALLSQPGSARADDFTFPQGVYSEREVELGEYPNAAVVNATLLKQSALTRPVEPYTVGIMDGIRALVGYHWGYKAVIEGDGGADPLRYRGRYR